MKLLTACLGAAIGALTATVLYSILVPPKRVNYAFVSGREPLFVVDWQWLFTVGSGAVIGAAAGVWVGIVIRRRRGR
ncbi:MULTISPECIES: hypothetical protein [Nocardiaceae]|uniref:Membrane protein YfcA n=1 Tax=Rhodococcoides corynebacterioides TaxID=53972 RepID=A0ABS2KPD6_9NOCA|nr:MULTISPECIES: hypothetical protein [Rhodococcus]MBM7413822.1 putative membrane protein YfcA [Rhodococcus corynebacterioides]MBP1116285.1 putative membrane protein YfcA [Rhodococcus sp. PvP016]